MSIVLYVRNEKPPKKSDHTIHSGFTAQGRFTSYHKAVLKGMNLAGPGNFYVDTNMRVPTREEQLLLPPIKCHFGRSHPKLAEAILID